MENNSLVPDFPTYETLEQSSQEQYEKYKKKVELWESLDKQMITLEKFIADLKDKRIIAVYIEGPKDVPIPTDLNVSKYIKEGVYNLIKQLKQWQEDIFNEVVIVPPLGPEELDPEIDTPPVISEEPEPTTYPVFSNKDEDGKSKNWYTGDRCWFETIDGDLYECTAKTKTIMSPKQSPSNWMKLTNLE
jgi:hypothetical protein